MARGTAVNEPVVSQAETREFDEGFDRTFGKVRRGSGRFVWDPERKALVPASEYREARALDAPILAGRFYENTSASDGTDIGSREKHRRYMRERGLTTMDDYAGKGGSWDKAEAKRAQGFMTPEQRKARQEALGRRMYEIEKKPQREYDREVAERARRRAERGPGEPTEG